MVLNRVGPVSCAKLAGTLYAIMGFVFGALFSLFAVAGGFASDDSGVAGLGAIVGVGAVVVLPLLYGVLGFVMTLIGAWLYNVVAGLVGGVEMDLQ